MKMKFIKGDTHFFKLELDPTLVIDEKGIFELNIYSLYSKDRSIKKEIAATERLFRIEAEDTKDWLYGQYEMSIRHINAKGIEVYTFIADKLSLVRHTEALKNDIETDVTVSLGDGDVIQVSVSSKGAKGDAFTFEDFTDEQIESLKVKGGRACLAADVVWLPRCVFMRQGGGCLPPPCFVCALPCRVPSRSYACAASLMSCHCCALGFGSPFPRVHRSYLSKMFCTLMQVITFVFRL